MAQLGSLSEEMETLNQVLRLVQAFKAFDSNNDGSITVEELGALMGSLGYNPSEQEVREMMERGDKNRDGLLSIQEFLDMNTDELQLGKLATCMTSALGSLDDLEEDDVVTGDMLFGALRNMGLSMTLDNCRHLIASMDGDGDGAISFEDFKLIVNSVL